jgi:plasmid stability protein
MGKSDALSRRADHGTGVGDNSNVTLLHPEFFATHAVRALSGLSLEGEERDILRDIRKANREGKQEDAVAKSARELRRSEGKSV